MRRSLLLFHRWAGIVSALFLVLVAVSGSALVFEDNIDRLLNRHTGYVTPQTSTVPVEALVQAAAKAQPNVRATGVQIPARGDWAYRIALSNGLTAHLNPYTGQVLGVRNLQTSFARYIHLLHTRFVAGRSGEIFVGWLTVVTLAMSVTGLILWWPRRIFGVGRYSSWRRSNFDLHNALGFWASVFIFFISLTGIIIAFEGTLDPVIEKLNGPQPTVDLEKLRSTPVPGGTRVSMDEVLRTANATLPGAFAASVNVPSKPTDFFRVLMKFPEDRTPSGRSRVYLDQFSGRVLAVTNTRTAPLGTAILNVKRSLHTGDIFGAPTQALYFFASLALAGQVITGLLIWWRPTKKPTSKSERRPRQSAA